MQCQTTRALIGALLLLSPLAAMGQPAPAAGDREPASRCQSAPPTLSATPPATGSAHSGTAPGGMGSTGWSGGTGGSHIGTSPAGPTAASPNQHPQTAQGLDPTRPQAQPGPNPSPC